MASRPYRLSVICQSRGESVARPEGLEPSTPGLEGRCSIQLSYGRGIPIIEQERLAIRRVKAVTSPSATLAPFQRSPLAVGRSRLTSLVTATQAASQFVQKVVVIHRHVVRGSVVDHRFGGADREQIIRERSSDVVHVADLEAADV
jgi:hypothetical protein